MKKCTNTADLFAWADKRASRAEAQAIKAARIAAMKEAVDSGKVIKTDVFKWKMIRQGGKAASVRKGEWPARAFWREEPGEIVTIRRQA